MDLIGTKIKHNAWGSGTIVEFDGKYITARFSIGDKKFAYPSAFEKFLKAENAEIQQLIVCDINKANAKAEQKKKDDEVARELLIEQRRATKAITSHKTHKARALDEMFAADYHVEKLARQPILSYKQVEEQFGIRISGFGKGINPTENTVVLISSIGKNRDNFVYHDRWTADGNYLYSGEGKTGNQSMSKGNLAIKETLNNNKTIHLFVKFSPQEYYYQGVFKLVDYTYEDDTDEAGNTRKEYKFRLKKV